MTEYVSVNINRPRDDWKRPRTWYKVVAVIMSIPSAVSAFVVFTAEAGVVLGCLGGIVFWIISVYSGVLGGIIGNGIRYMTQPRSIHVKNPSLSDLISLRIYWSFIIQLSGIVAGSTVLPVAICRIFAAA